MAALYEVKKDSSLHIVSTEAIQEIDDFVYFSDCFEKQKLPVLRLYKTDSTQSKQAVHAMLYKEAPPYAGAVVDFMWECFWIKCNPK